LELLFSFKSSGVRAALHRATLTLLLGDPQLHAQGIGTIVPTDGLEPAPATPGPVVVQGAGSFFEIAVVQGVGRAIQASCRIHAQISCEGE
jgi:hypothetical protein